MGKAAAAIGVTGTGAVAVCGAYALGAFGGTKDEHITSKPVPVVFNESLENFKENDGNKCLSRVFNNWTSGSLEIGNLSADDKLPEVKSKDDFKLGGSATSEVTKGCLDYRVNVDKEWVGSNFRFVWVLSRGNRGFVIYMSATGQPSKVMEFKGAVYVLEKQTEKGSAKKLEMKSENKNLSGNDLREKFPQRGDVFKSSISKYWNFLNDEGNDIKRDAKKPLVKEPDPRNFTTSKGGEGQFGGNNEAVSGSSNLDIGGSHFFGDNFGKLSELIGSVKGTGL